MDRKRAADGTFVKVYGYRPLTQEEMAERATERKRIARETNREEHTRKNREWNFRRKYGITLAQYDAMRAAQGYRCAICGLHEDELPRARSRRTTDGLQTIGTALSVDHCHTTNRVRKLLCHKCNQGIGCFKEDPSLLAAAVRYLQEVCPVTPR